MDKEKLQKDFPIVTSTHNGAPLVYLDSSNTSLTPEPVLEAMNKYYREYNANIHRGIYPISEKATYEHEQARQKVTDFIKAKSSKEIVFVRNATEAINLVAHTWGRTHLKKEHTIVLSIMEHHSNIVPWQILQKDIGFKIKFLNIDDQGTLDIEEFKQMAQQENIALLSLVYESNALGTINPVKQYIDIAHKNGIVTLIDACQTVPHMPIDVTYLDSDFLVFTGHKLYGPTGIGVLHAKQDLLEELPPFLGGGDMIRSVSKTETTWNDIPYKFEAGTPNIAGAIGLGSAMDYMNAIGINTIQEHENHLAELTLKKFQAFEGLKLFGPHTMENRGTIFSFAIDGIHPHDIASFLGEKNICVRAGHHCAQPLMENLNIPATSRLSLGVYNTEQDIETFFKELKVIQKIFN